jgi:quinol---cytochrome-c reductase cytochrome c subunit
MAAILVVGAVALMAVGVWDPSTLLPGRTSASEGGRTMAAGPVVVADEASARGRELFLASCSACHGADGRGTSRGPSLAEAGPAAWHFYLATGRMPLQDAAAAPQQRQPAFDDADIAALVAYGQTLGSGPAQPTLVSDVDVGEGGRLFLNDCAACHGAAASGAAVGAHDLAPSLRGVDPQIIAEALLVGPGVMPRFQLDDRQASDIAAYVGQLGTASPGGFPLDGIGPVAEGLIAVGLGLLLLLLVARWIGADARTEEGTPGDPGGTVDDQA